MARSRFDRARVFVNAANLIVSIAFVVGAAWAISSRAGPEGESWLSPLFGPLVQAYAWHAALGPGGKALAVAVAIAAVVVLLLALLLSFRIHREELAVMILAVPFYLVTACVVFLTASFIISVITSVVGSR